MSDVLAQIQKIKEYRETHKLEFYKPYEYQKKFHSAKGFDKFVPVPSDTKKEGLAIQRALRAANQVGKTYSGAIEMAYHLTGQYPEWWEGHRFTKPITALVSGKTNDTTKNILQTELFGDSLNEKKLGTGAIPLDCIGKITKKAGVPNAYSEVLIKHIKGWSKVFLLSYEMKAKAFMGYRTDVSWLDEEPPSDIYAQILRSQFATNGVVYMTFTPEEGVTEIVHKFDSELGPGQALITATWDDAPHMTPETIEQKLASIPPHEREMRSKGVPIMGSGLVWPVPESQIITDPIEIQPYWRRIVGVDFGWDHPFAAAWIAHDTQADVVYVTDTFRQSHATIAVCASAIKKKGDWIPCMWPHDGLIHDKASGKPLADLYREEGVYMWRDQFSNPPAPGQKEGQGGNGVEVGILDILERMETGRFKVFSTCKDWFEEWRMYHRKDGKIVKLRDDLMSATRYAVMMLRHAQTKPVPQRKVKIQSGLRNW